MATCTVPYCCAFRQKDLHFISTLKLARAKKNKYREEPVFCRMPSISRNSRLKLGRKQYKQLTRTHDAIQPTKLMKSTPRQKVSIYLTLMLLGTVQFFFNVNLF